MNRKVLIVDDDKDLLQLLTMRLQSEEFEVSCAQSAEQALELLEVSSPSVLLTDLRMDGMNGLALLEEIHQNYPSIPVVILTAHGSIPDAVKAAQKGVFAFLTKPVDKQELVSTLDNAIQTYGGEDVVDETWPGKITTRSVKMQELLKQAKLVAKSNVSVLIHGESGTGKELLAQAIHHSSQRRKAAFVPINCGAIPEHLLESELFGYKKGAFTGADKDREGLFTAANGGTLFLDEIGDMPKSLQVKLLRVLQEGMIRPVGSSSQYPIDVRIIAATHRNLIEEVSRDNFREDLFYRLNVVTLNLPRLSERQEDIPILAHQFLADIAKKNKQSPKRLANDALEHMLNCKWPGNIRQLQNFIEKAVALSNGRIIPLSAVKSDFPATVQDILPLTQAKAEFEKQYIKNLLKLSAGNIPEAAKLAGRNRSDFYKIVKRHHIESDYYKITKALKNKSAN